jgi:hypothetical protein
VTFGRVTQYMSVYLSMNFSGKVYPRISWVHACLYMYSWFFVLTQWLEWRLAYPSILAHDSHGLTSTSEYILCATAFSCLRPAGRPAPGPCWPAACTLRALLPVNLKAAHSWQKQDTLAFIDSICVVKSTTSQRILDSNRTVVAKLHLSTTKTSSRWRVQEVYPWSPTSGDNSKLEVWIRSPRNVTVALWAAGSRCRGQSRCCPWLCFCLKGGSYWRRRARWRQT